MDYPQRTQEEQAAFFGAICHATEAAERVLGTRAVALVVAGLRVELVFAGPALEEELMPALRHLVIEERGQADATIHVWDSTSTGVTMPPPPCKREHFTDRGDLWGFTSDRYRFAFHWIECSVNAIDLDTGVGVFWVQSAYPLPYWTKASPLRSLFHWVVEKHGGQLLHAAAVGNENGAVLITGKGGVGKSTTALAGLADGLQYVSDDYLVVTNHGQPVVHSLYSTAKLNADQVTRFPQFQPHVTNVGSLDDEKAVMRLFPALSSRITRSMPLRAVLTPRVAPQRDTAFAPTSSLRLERAAAFTTLSQLPYAGQGTQAFIERLVRQVPGLEVVLGSDLKGVARAITDLLAQDDATLWAMAAPTATRRAAEKRPLITVVVPVHNGARFLRDAIDNILSQDYPALEIIVVDDGSTDAIDEAVAGLPVDVRFFKQRNAGPASARNRGICDASGDVIAFLDVDDLWPPDNLTLLCDALLEEPDLAVVRGHAQLMTLDEQAGTYVPCGNPAESFPSYIGCGLYRRRAFEVVGLFDSTLRFAEDADWYNRLAESGLPSRRLPHVTLHVRRHGGNMTAALTREQLLATKLPELKRLMARKRQAGRQPHPA